MNLPTINILIPAATLICFSFLLLVFCYSKKNKVRKLYSIFLILMFAWSLGSLFMRLEVFPGSLFWNRIMLAGTIGIPILFYHFSLVYTNANSSKLLLKIGYLGSLMLQIMNLRGYVVKSAYMSKGILVYEMDYGSVIFAFWGVSYVLLSIINIIRQVTKKEVSFANVKYILVGMILSQIGTLLNLEPNIGKYPVDIALNTANALLIAYSIYRYRFLGARLLIRKVMLSVIYIINQALLFSVLLYGILILLEDNLFCGIIISGAVLGVLNTFLTNKIMDKIINYIDNIFYKDKVNQKSSLRRYSQAISSTLDINEIIKDIIEVVNDTVQPENIYLLLDTKGEQSYKVIKCCKEDNIYEKEFLMNKSHPLVKWFKENNILTGDEVNDGSYFKSLWSAEKEQINKMNPDLLIPIKLRDNLIGIIIVSEKKDGTPYQKDDIDILMTIANGAAVVIENAGNYMKAKVQAITDGLTGLYNHRHFYECLDEIILLNEYDRFSIAMLDVDYFKFYNDLYGHSAGDKALKEIAKILKKEVKNKGIATRYGGEEFALILPNLSADETYKLVDNLRMEIQLRFNESTEVNQFLSISAGIASYPENASNKEEILEKADKAMYHAKRSGRNRCVIYEKNIVEKEVKKEGEDILLSSVYALAAAIDAKDHYTFGHSENVAKFGVMLGRELGFNKEKLEIIRNAGLLHDIGKIGIPESILTKPGKLTDEEYEIMKKHVELSVAIFKHIPNLTKVIPAVICHHERYDGKGYPRGIKGNNIPIEARCLTVVDSFDAMVSHRPYKNPLTLDQAINQLVANKGTQFDPDLVDVFLKVIKKNKEAFQVYYN